MPNQPPNHLNRNIALQRAALLWEKLWQAASTPLLVLGVGVIIIASGVLSAFPQSLQVIVLALLALIFIYASRNVFKLRAPSRYFAMRRLEQASTISHRGISSHEDELVEETQNPETAELWNEHQHRALERLAEVKIAPPQSNWRDFDPRAFRVPVALGALAAVLLGPGDLISNTRNAAHFSIPGSSPPLSIDAWLKPPSYTGKTPLLLTSAAMVEKLKSGGDLLVPENSSLTLRLQGAERPNLKFYPIGATSIAEAEIKSFKPKSTTTETGFTSEIKLDRPAIVKVFDGETELASWPVSLIPDEPPKIKIIGDPKGEALGGLTVAWETADDYGVKSITSEISLADQQENGVGFENNGVFLFDAPEFKIASRHPNDKAETGTTTQNLSPHPWAGLYVEMTLTATDGAGHTTTTEPKRFKLPERDFSNFLAKAVIEQRKSLILNPDSAPDVATLLDAMLAYPYLIRENTGLILNLAYVKSALANAGDTEDVGTTIADLWPIAVAIEDGVLADARAELKALKEQLEQALRDGAPPEKIAELTDKMRKAMDRLLDQMRKQAEKRSADSNPNKQKMREITKDELQKMLDDIKKLSESGSKDAAEQLLSELDKLLQNLEPGTGQQADQNGDPSLQNQLDELSNLMRRQQDLMDKTQRLPQPNPEQQDGQQGSNNKPDDGSNLADRQGSLSDQLDRLGQQLEGGTAGNFGDATKNMKGAEGSLRDGSKDDALQQQGEAMREMQEGAKKLGKKLAQQGQGKTGDQGKDGEAGGSDDDPLGRPRSTHNPDTGPNKNLVPNEMAIRRAREILEQLRNRSNDQNLNETEKKYIERLLKGLY